MPIGDQRLPTNPIGAYLPSTQALDPGATGFFVYQANLGPTTLQSPSNPNVSPLENISPRLPLASYIVGFFNASTGFQATANSGAIFETTGVTPPPPHIPRAGEPGVAWVGFGGVGNIFSSPPALILHLARPAKKPRLVDRGFLTRLPTTTYRLDVPH
jgi:hypothetical protein